MDTPTAAQEPTVITGEVLEKEPRIVFQRRDGIAALVRFVEDQVNAHTPDVTTKAGRDAIASLAYKVARTKTLIDNTGKAITEDARKVVDSVNELRRDVKEKLEALQAKARKPLDEWEAAEDRRLTIIRDTKQRLSECRTIPMGATTAKLAAVLESVRTLAFDPNIFQDNMEEMEADKAATLAALETAHATAVKAEEDARELAKLRAENEARIAREKEAERVRLAEEARLKEEARIREEAAEKARQEEREHQAAKERADQAERDRVASERLEEERAKERQRQAELDAANERARAAAAEAQRLRDVADAEAREKAWLVFRIREVRYRITTGEIQVARGRKPEAEARRQWRAILLLVKAKVVSIVEGISTVEREFLSDAIMPDGSVLSDHAPKLIENAYREGGPPRLMIGGPQ